MTRATMSDVAKAAGVSMKSVSRVINDEPNISARLRAKVEDAVARLAYVPDLAARSLAGARSFSIAILFEDYGEAFMPSYFPKLQAGAYKACRDAGYHMLVETISSEGGDFPERFTRMLQTLRVDGVILAPPFSDHHGAMDLLDTRAIPFVRVAPFDNPDRARHVAIDDQAAAGEMTRHLWALGHRRIGFVAGLAMHGSAHARRKGFVETLARLGCTDFVETYGGFQFEIGIKAAAEIMNRPDPPTAIFAANDDSAAGVMAGLAQLGLKVPDDVSVVGFDNSWIAESVWPYLTTMHQPISEMGFAAAAMLIGRSGNGGLAIPELATPLIERGSAAPPRAKA